MVTIPGGEQSGHIIFLMCWLQATVFDLLQLLKVMLLKGEPLSELAAIMPRFPQLLINCRVKNKDAWENNQRIVEAVKEAEKRLTGGRVLVRASGTEPLIRIMLEGKDASLLKTVSRELAEIVNLEMGIPE